MPSRYFSDDPIPWPTEGTVRLVDNEAHHFLHVMRGKIGDRLTLFDGSGAEFEAEVTKTTRREVMLAVLSREEVDREPGVELTLGVAIPKGDRQKVLVEKLTELGVARLVPLVTERSVAAPKASGLEKLRRAVVEASKQCGRNRLMVIDEPVPLAEFLASTEADRRLIAHPYGGTAVEPPAAGTIAVAVGPEGGFSDSEVATARDAGWAPLTLGRSILRIETAAIGAAAILACGRK